jgi:hypothetical protein
MHDKTRAEFAPCVESFQIVKQDLCGRLIDQCDMNEHRHLLKNEGAPKRMRVQIIGVSQGGLGPDIFEPGGVKVTGKVEADRIVVARLSEDRIECVEVRSIQIPLTRVPLKRICSTLK